MRSAWVFATALTLCLVWVGSPAAGIHAGGTTISPTFVSKTDRLCASINADFGRALGKPFPFSNFDPAHPDSKTLVKVGKYFSKALPVHRKIPARLRALGEPAQGRSAWDTIRSLALEDNTVAIEQVAAALAGNKKTFVATYKRLVRLHGQITKDAAAAGFPKSTPCADTF